MSMRASKGNDDPLLLVVIIPTWDLHRALERVDDLIDLESGGDSMLVRTHYIVVSQQINDGRDVEAAVEVTQSTRAFPYLDVIHTRPLLPTQAMALGGLSAMVKGADILMFLHDDVQVLEPAWDERVAVQFVKYDRCGLVGFGGATFFGSEELYRAPYEHTQLARYNFLSQLTDWNIHGGYLNGTMQAAALDGFSLILSRDAYEQMGEWIAAIEDGIHFHMYDAWVSCRMQELGLETWMLPVRCSHAGGGTSVKHSDVYEKLVRENGYESGQDLYDKAHRRIYDRFRGVIPFKGGV